MEAYPLKTKSANEVAAGTMEVFYRHGAAGAIRTDQGKEFNNNRLDSFQEAGQLSQWANTYTIGIPVVFDIAGTLLQQSAQLLKEYLHIMPPASMTGGLPILE
ncbi:Hypp9604 [Branchiostoma lanceolatum]|uniref:Hypp9604 protein n=1 Tax=Branchiostoma lanceolatum TaxID=7740 RepID=A0A8S4MPF1_BRALA|nr:Hypp9604 [Branchiostoma lanceolatum]